MTFLITQWKFVVIAVLLALLGVQQVRIERAHAETAKVEREFAEARQQAAEAAQKAEQEAREEEQRREQRKEEIINEAEQRTELAQAAATDAKRAADGLRERLAAFTAAVRGATKDSSPAKPSEGKPSTDALDVLAGVLTRASDGAGELASYADALRIAGLACERSYDGLQPR
ncbi:DUF2514 family protein [Variovorax paradoxus]|nr:DUF2514 family protein [Variovorax paradoxus]MBT2300352.1 DUF2514 family protein [Variovorax paradoxus]